MNVSMQDLSMITEDVLQTVVGLAPEALVPQGTSGPHPDWMSGKIEIHGKWSGELSISCGPETAGLLASAFFGDAAPANALEDATAALLELANILAGHVNALMEAPSRITLPHSVTNAAPQSKLPLGTKSELAVAVSCAGKELLITLREMTSGTTGAS